MALSEEIKSEILKKQELYHTSYLQFGIRKYQLPWVEVLATTNTKRNIISAPTGTGKSTVSGIFLNNIDFYSSGSKSITIYTTPPHVQGIIEETFNKMTEKIPSNVGFVVTSSLNNSLQNNILKEENKQYYNNNKFILNLEREKADYVNFLKHYKHIIVFASYLEAKKYCMVHQDGYDHPANPILICDEIQDYDKRYILDECHWGNANTNSERYAADRENSEVSFTYNGITLQNFLVNKGFTYTGFTATPTPELKGEYGDGIFMFHGLSDEDKIGIALMRTYIQDISYLSGDLGTKTGSFRIKRPSCVQKNINKEYTTLSNVFDDIWDALGKQKMSIPHIKERFNLKTLNKDHMISKCINKWYYQKRRRGEDKITTNDVEKRIDNIVPAKIGRQAKKELCVHNTENRKYRCNNVTEWIRNSVFERKGICIAFTRFHRGGDIDEIKTDDMIEILQRMQSKRPFLVWQGSNEKYIMEYTRGKGWRERKYRKYNTYKTTLSSRYSSSDSVNDVLDKNPDVKVIIVKSLLECGFDRPNVNSILFGKKIKKTKAFFRELQQVGRGVRLDENKEGLCIGFSASHKQEKDTEKRFVRELLGQRDILYRDEYNELSKAYKEEPLISLTEKDADIFYNVISEIKEDFISKVQSTIESQAKESYNHIISANNDRQHLSARISNSIEHAFHDSDLCDRMDGYERVDGIINLYNKKEPDIFGVNDFFAYDIKHTLKKSEGNKFVSDDLEPRKEVSIKDSMSGSGKINTDVIHIIIVTELGDVQINGGIKEMNMYVVLFSKELGNTKVSIKKLENQDESLGTVYKYKLL